MRFSQTSAHVGAPFGRYKGTCVWCVKVYRGGDDKWSCLAACGSRRMPMYVHVYVHVSACISSEESLFVTALLLSYLEWFMDACLYMSTPGGEGGVGGQ